ncbi:MAG: hypothetical protein AVDCRST_MAG93-9309, partial [uncultured Chloroflexia bacterium]
QHPSGSGRRHRHVRRSVSARRHRRRI